MIDSPKRLTRFWQELKRRKVIYVIMVYASAAYVIIELLGNLKEALNLPENLSTIVLIALAIAFPIIIVLSWIFDVKPGGIQKTGPVDEIAEGKKEVTSNAWRIATFASVVIIAGLIIFNVFTRLGLTENLSTYGKSIAVLPFINDSQDVENEIFINGCMESILNRLSNIKDLRVMQRESVEQYRDTLVSVAEISKKLGVAYVLRGSMRIYGEMYVINLQLIDHDNKTIWAYQHEKNINELEGLFILESQIAREVARKIKADITPEEAQRIEKVPTTNSTAYQLWQRGFYSFMQFLNYGDFEAFSRAENLNNEALKHDSTLANAWAGLGWIFYFKNAFNPMNRRAEDFLDSVLIYSDIALSFDNKFSNAYVLRGRYYWETGEKNKELESYNKALEFNPNDAQAYAMRANLHQYLFNNYVDAVKDYEEAEKRQQGGLTMGSYYQQFGNAYMNSGFGDKAKEFFLKILAFTNDSADYYRNLAWIESSRRNYQSAIELDLKANEISPSYVPNIKYICFSHRENEAYNWVRQMDNFRRFDATHAAFILWKNGEKEKAELSFNSTIESFNLMSGLGRREVAAGDFHEDLISIYALKGQKDSAYYYLEEFINMKSSFLLETIARMKDDPMLNSIREEKRFKDLIQKMEAKYLTEHERMRLYLEETGRL